MIRVVHHRFGDERRSGDSLQRGDRACTARRTVHATGVQLDHAMLVRQPAQPHGLVIWVELLDVDTGDDRVERIRITDQHVVSPLDAALPVG